MVHCHGINERVTGLEAVAAGCRLLTLLLLPSLETMAVVTTVVGRKWDGGDSVCLRPLPIPAARRHAAQANT